MQKEIKIQTKYLIALIILILLISGFTYYFVDKYIDEQRGLYYTQGAMDLVNAELSATSQLGYFEISTDQGVIRFTPTKV